MKHGIESKQQGVTLRSSYKPSFEGSFELMAPELDPSMVRKWLRNIGDTSEKPKLKDFWEKNLLTLQREIKVDFEPPIYLLNSVTESNEAHLPAQTATRSLLTRRRKWIPRWTKLDAMAVILLAVRAIFQVAKGINKVAVPVTTTIPTRTTRVEPTGIGKNNSLNSQKESISTAHIKTTST